MGQAGKHTHSPRDPTSSQWPIMDTRGRSWPIRGPAAALCRLLPESLRSGIAPSRAHSTSSTERGPQHPSPAAGTLADRPTMAPFHLQDFPSSQDDGIRAWPPGLTLHLPRGQVTFQLVGPRGRGRQRSPGWSSSSPGCARFPHCPPPPSTAPPPPKSLGLPNQASDKEAFGHLGTKPLLFRQVRAWLCEGAKPPGLPGGWRS